MGREEEEAAASIENASLARGCAGVVVVVVVVVIDVAFVACGLLTAPRDESFALCLAGSREDHRSANESDMVVVIRVTRHLKIGSGSQTLFVKNPRGKYYFY